MRKNWWMNCLVLLSFIPTLVFWPSILSSSSIKQRQEKTGTPAAQAQEQKPPLETFIDSLDQALSKLGNKKLAVLAFESLEGPGLEREAAVASEKLVQALVNSGRFEIVDRAFLNLKSVGELNPEIASRWTSNLGLGAIIAGTVSRGAGNEVDINLRVINLKTLSIILTGQLKMRPAGAAGSQPGAQANQGVAGQGRAGAATTNPLYDQLQQKIAALAASRIDAQSREKLIMETIGEAFKATPKRNTAMPISPVGWLRLFVSSLALRTGFTRFSLTMNSF
ncbi:MAG: hypothetical protein JHC32_06580 [Candidatus Aminicenantes bacterium]|nr:hypothetical protein [Candidatus Aminicenantes bacterium]